MLHATRLRGDTVDILIDVHQRIGHANVVGFLNLITKPIYARRCLPLNQSVFNGQVRLHFDGTGPRIHLGTRLRVLTSDVVPKLARMAGFDASLAPERAIHSIVGMLRFHDQFLEAKMTDAV